MKVASYIATQAGAAGLMNRLIRKRFGGKFFTDGEASHNEVVFEPGDGVDQLMPDGTTETVNGTVWCASSSSLDKIPYWSGYRAKKLGGVRFKRIALNPEKWEIREYNRDAKTTALWFKQHEGQAYNWGQILGFLGWWVSLGLRQGKRWTCATAIIEAGGYTRSDLFHPAILRSMVK